MIVVAKKNISVLQLFISRMPKMCAIGFGSIKILYQLQNISGGATHKVSTVADNTYI